MTVWGADVDELDRTAASFIQMAETLDTCRAQLNARVHTTTSWRGESADRFRRDWDQLYVPRLAAAVAFLREASVALRRNATEQRQASSSDGLHRSGGGDTMSTGFGPYFAQGAGKLFNAVDQLSAISGHATFLAQFFQSHPFFRATPFEGGVLSGFGIAVDGSKLVGHMAVHDYHDASYDGGHLLVDAADLRYGVAAGDLIASGGNVVLTGASAGPLGVGVVGAGMLGAYIGTSTGHLINHHTNFDSSVVSSGADHVAADPNQLTPHEADQLVDRYRGASGVVHYGEDTVGSAARFLRGL